MKIVKNCTKYALITGLLIGIGYVAGYERGRERHNISCHNLIKAELGLSKLESTLKKEKNNQTSDSNLNPKSKEQQKHFLDYTLREIYKKSSDEIRPILETVIGEYTELKQ